MYFKNIFIYRLLSAKHAIFAKQMHSVLFSYKTRFRAFITCLYGKDFKARLSALNMHDRSYFNS